MGRKHTHTHTPTRPGCIHRRVCTAQAIPYTYLQMCGGLKITSVPFGRTSSAGLLFFHVPGGHELFRSLQHPLVPRRPIVHLRRKGPYGSVNSEFLCFIFFCLFGNVAFSEYFFKPFPFLLNGECVVRSFLRMLFFLPCNHELDFRHQVMREFNQSIIFGLFGVPEYSRGHRRKR